MSVAKGQLGFRNQKIDRLVCLVVLRELYHEKIAEMLGFSLRILQKTIEYY